MIKITTILTIIGMIVALATVQIDRDLWVAQSGGAQVSAARSRRGNRRGRTAVASRKDGRQPLAKSGPQVLDRQDHGHPPGGGARPERVRIRLLWPVRNRSGV